eukprot:7346592-Alexandrium_andersonii.AAC.1
MCIRDSAQTHGRCVCADVTNVCTLICVGLNMCELGCARARASICLRVVEHLRVCLPVCLCARVRVGSISRVVGKL